MARSARIGVVIVLLVLLTWWGPEAHGVRFGMTGATGDATMLDSPAEP